MANSVQDVFIYGAGGLSKDVTMLIEDINSASKHSLNIAGYIVTNPEDSTFMGRAVVPEEDFLRRLRSGSPASVVIAIGTPAVRTHIVSLLAGCKVTYPTLIHPRANLNRMVSVGKGVVVCANVVFGADATVGNHTYINIAATIGHDVEIGDFVQIEPQSLIMGTVKIGDGCLIGTGSAIRQGITIGPGSIVGLGAAVVHDVLENTTVVGNPARPLPTAR